MQTIRTTKIIYWVATGIIFLFEGVMPALTSHTQLAVEGIRHLGYPPYFGVMLSVFKVLGALVLILPFIKGTLKEWAYAGFVFTTIAACISHWVVDGFGELTVFPLIILAIVIISHIYYHKLSKAGNYQKINRTNYVVSGVPQ